MLPRTLEPEVMDTEEDALQYNEMDHAEVNRLFVSDLLEFARSVWESRGSDEASNSTENGDAEQSDGEAEFRLGDVLDIGTGTALIPVELCLRHESCRVMACDMATNMLDLAVYNISFEMLNDRITLEQADAKSLIFADDMFDVVMSNSIMHHLPQPSDCVPEMLRVLRPDGILFVRDLMRPTDSETAEQLVATYTGNESEYSQRLFRESLHAALSLDEIRQLVTEHGFEAKTVQATSDRHWTWSGRLRLPPKRRVKSSQS
jgi:ubiquinone/menaquinone biosynthesis C-methylase UbiE